MGLRESTLLSGYYKRKNQGRTGKTGYRREGEKEGKSPSNLVSSRKSAGEEYLDRGQYKKKN